MTPGHNNIDLNHEDYYELVKVRVPYRQVFKRKPRGRTPFYRWFREDVDIKIDVVDADAAPVAYEVLFGPPTNPRSLSYQIRAYQDRLWWPLGGDYNYVVHRETFRTWLEDDGHPEILALLDPAFAAYEGPWPLAPFPEQRLEAVEHDMNNLEDRRAVAQRGASTTIFCGDGVFVQAGEPVFYATGDGKSLSLAVGVSDPRRECCGKSSSEPGPTRLDRKDCARRGFAFGIAELDEGIRALQARGYSIEIPYKVDVLLERHRPETAALLCARELAGALYEESKSEGRRAAGLRAGVPIIRAAADLFEVDALCVEVLHQLRSSRDAVVAYDFVEERRSAQAILGRLDALGVGLALAPEEDQALASLGPG